MPSLGSDSKDVKNKWSKLIIQSRPFGARHWNDVAYPDSMKSAEETLKILRQAERKKFMRSSIRLLKRTAEVISA